MVTTTALQSIQSVHILYTLHTRYNVRLTTPIFSQFKYTVKTRGLPACRPIYYIRTCIRDYTSQTPFVFDIANLSELELPRAGNTSFFVLRWTDRLFDVQA